MRKCDKTVSGKHMWRMGVFAFYEAFDYPIGKPKVVTQCFACGLIDDTKPREGKG